MSIRLTENATTLTVENLKYLLAAWKNHKIRAGHSLIKSFHCESRLTEAPYRLLLAELRELMPDGRQATVEVPARTLPK